MSLGLEDLLPTEDSLLFKEPQPVVLLWPLLLLPSCSRCCQRRRTPTPALIFLTSPTSASRMSTLVTWSSWTWPQPQAARGQLLPIPPAQLPTSPGPTLAWETCTSTRWPLPLATARLTSLLRRLTGSAVSSRSSSYSGLIIILLKFNS